MRLLPTYLLIALLAGCNVVPLTPDYGGISGRLLGRHGTALSPEPPPRTVFLPNGAALDQGLTEEEATLIAVWNNAPFRELLTELDVAHSDLVAAGLLPNPEVLYFFHVPDKPFKYAFELPIDAMWLRPLRVEAAGREVERVNERLTQAGLDLIRDTRQAFADLLAANGRLKVGRDALKLRGDIARLAQARLKEGDISPQEAATARIDADLAEQDLARLTYEVRVVEDRLRFLMGLGTDCTALVLDETPIPRRDGIDPEALIALALDSRPDVLAAERALAAADERLRLAKLSWFRFLVIGDASSGQRTGREFGPAFRVTLPLWNFGEGAIARAEADRHRALRQRETAQQTIVLDIRQGFHRYQQARAELAVLEGKVLPDVTEAIQKAESAYREGNTTYVVVLETTRQLLDSRARKEQLEADLRRAWADLERGAGRRLDVNP
jgi:cobalt-zinc-cadmium efflux system outer membrane protein